MIRDPSDGSVGQRLEPLKMHANASEGDQLVIGPNPLFEAIRAALLAGKVKPERVSDEWEYQRAWNDGIDFGIEQVRRLSVNNGNDRE